MSELNTTRLLSNLRHLIECATKGKAPTPLFLIGHAELVLSAVEKIESLKQQRDKATAKNHQDKIRSVHREIEMYSWPRQLAAVLSPGKFSWHRSKPIDISTPQQRLLRCLLDDKGKPRKPVPAEEVLLAVFGRNNPFKKLRGKLKDVIKGLKRNLVIFKVKAVLSWNGRGSLALVDLSGEGEPPPP